MGEVDAAQHVTWRAILAHTAEATGDRTVARWLCEHASGCDADEFVSVLDEFVPQRAALHLDAMLRRHLGGEPLQYAMGRWAFRRLDLMVDPRVLIPRPETERLVDIVHEHLRVGATKHGDKRVVADLGTGSGAIGLALLDELAPSSVEVWMTDASPDALDVARANAVGLGVRGAGARFATGEWFDALPADLRGRLDVVVSNPPYIAIDDPAVEPSVRDWEPAVALYSGHDGLDAVRCIVNGAHAWLRPGGLLALEIGHAQGGEVVGLMHAAGLLQASVTRDLAGHDRYATALAPG